MSDIFSKYKSSYVGGFSDLFLGTICTSVSYYSLWYFKESYLSILTIILYALMNLKMFIIFHDCCHDSYTPSPTLNRIIATFMAPFLYFTESWRYTHNTHHVANGRKGNSYEFAHNELIFYTLQQYKEMSPAFRALVKTVLHPINLFTILTYTKFIILHRFYALGSCTRDRHADLSRPSDIHHHGDANEV